MYYYQIPFAKVSKIAEKTKNSGKNDAPTRIIFILLLFTLSCHNVTMIFKRCSIAPENMPRGIGKYASWHRKRCSFLQKRSIPRGVKGASFRAKRSIVSRAMEHHFGCEEASFSRAGARTFIYYIGAVMEAPEAEPSGIHSTHEEGANRLWLAPNFILQLLI